MSGLTYQPKRKIGFMGHLIANYPSPKAALAMIGAMVAAGVDFIEIQIPFSEPVADGPLFLVANHEALANGVTYQQALELMFKVSVKYPQTQFLFMTYLNPVFRRGYDQFCEEAAGAGAKGMIIPDLPMEMAGPLAAAAKKHGVSKVQLMAPNASPDRLRALAQSADGMIYAVARAGVTGATTRFDEGVLDFVRSIKQHTEVPVALGFGIKDPQDIAFLRGTVDIAVVGSQAMRVYQSEGLSGFQRFWEGLITAGEQEP